MGPMTTTYLLRIGLGLVAWATFVACAAELPTVATWDFNVSGALHASEGAGEIRLLGGVSSTPLSGAPSDPAATNLSLGVRGFPPQGEGRRSAGVEFTIDGVFKRLGVAFDVRVSPTACARLAVLVQDGAGDFQEAGTLELKQDNVFVPMTLDLSGVLDPLAVGLTRVRIVADTGEDGFYPAVKPRSNGSSPYSPLGVWRFDRVVFRGVLRETVEQPFRISVEGRDDGLGLKWDLPDAEQFTLWKAPTPSGPWAVAGLLYNASSLEPMDEAMRFYRVTSP